MSINQSDKRLQKKERAYKMRRSLLDGVMGLLYAAVGIGLLVMKDDQGEPYLPPPFSYVFVGICLLYGGFRIYRAIKQDYFSE